jgi:hypothetical protein
MRSLNRSLLVPAVILLSGITALAQKPDYSGIGKPATQDEIQARDLSIGPEGKELPPGSGTAKQGAVIFSQKCAMCHGPTGVESKLLFARLAGGKGSLTTYWPNETIGSFWPYATSVWDFIRRAMPEYPLGPDSLPKDYIFTERPIPDIGGGETGIGAGALGMQEGKLLTPDQVYALTAYILFRNDIIKEDTVLDRDSLPKIRMPNRDGFMPAADVPWVWQSRDPKTRIEPHVSPNSKPLASGGKSATPNS